MRVSRSQLPSLLVLCAAIAAGAAVFLAVGRMAGALYGAAALTLGLIFHQKLARGRSGDAAPPSTETHDRRRPRLPRPPGGRRAALREELVQVQAELTEREEARAALAEQLEDQVERTRALQASFAERVTDLTAVLESQQAEAATAKDAHETRVASLLSELARAQEELLSRDASLANVRRELDVEQARCRELAERLAHTTSVHREELARLVWRWRSHMEEIGALEAAIEAAARAT